MKIHWLPHKPILRFMTLTLLWLPFAFFIWYRYGAVLNWPVAWLLEGILPAQFPGLITSVEYQGGMIHLIIPYRTPEILAAGKRAELVADINPLAYGYGLPMLIALIIASPGREAVQWLRGVVGYGVIVLVQVFGCYFDGLLILQFKLPPELNSQLVLSSWQRDLIALGYQMGSLILPAVTPVVLWFVLYPAFPVSLLRLPAPGVADTDSVPASPTGLSVRH